jgi:hypothetical protein
MTGLLKARDVDPYLDVVENLVDLAIEKLNEAEQERLGWASAGIGRRASR